MMKGYNRLRKRILQILESQLPENIYYHKIGHTLDALRVCNHYIRREKIDANQAKLLRLAVLMHDAGFSISVQDHEMHSCRIAERLMMDHGFPESDIRMVKNMILATRIPQKPKNLLEKIICDADLDYLGRSDYYSKSHRLFKELKSRGVINSDKEWHKEQIQFLENHRYHTDFARKFLAPEKKKRLEELKRGLS